MNKTARIRHSDHSPAQLNHFFSSILGNISGARASASYGQGSPGAMGRRAACSSLIADLARVALTEASEETGIEGLEVWTVPVDVDIHLFVNRKPGSTEPDHLHLDLRFLVRAPEGAVAVRNHESEALRWITDDELDDPALSLDESTRRLARRGFGLARSL